MEVKCSLGQLELFPLNSGFYILVSESSQAHDLPENGQGGITRRFWYGVSVMSKSKC